METRSVLTAIAVALFACLGMFAADSKTTGVINGGASVFIAPMENGLDGFLAAEIVKRKLPVKVVLNETDAEYVLAGGSQKHDDKWFHTIFGGQDKNEGNVRLLSVREKHLVWAGEAGDRSIWWGNLKRGGQRKVAERIVKQMQKDLFKK